MDVDERFVTKRKHNRDPIPLPSHSSSSSHSAESLPYMPTSTPVNVNRFNMDRSFVDPPIETLSIRNRNPVRRTVSSKANLLFPVGRLKRYLHEDRFATKISQKSCVYLAAVLEYLTAEMLDISSDVATQHQRKRINPRHLTLGIKNDSELNNLLPNVTIKEGGVMPFIQPSLINTSSNRSPKSPKIQSSVQESAGRTITISNNHNNENEYWDEDE